MERSQDKSIKAAYGGVLAAVAASLCCIAPVLALLAGTTGVAATFSWLEPFRPYLIGFTILILGGAWYFKLRPGKAAGDDCGCAEDAKPTFLASKKFLLIITLFAALLLAFPNYMQVFYAQPAKELSIVPQTQVMKKVFAIEGMTCSSCEAPVESRVGSLPGILSVRASYDNANAVVEYDSTKVDNAAIIKAINSTGYKVVIKEEGNEEI